MYVVKLRYKGSLEDCYANNLQVQPIKDIRDEDSNFHLNHFLMPLQTAKELMFYLICRNNDEEEIHFDDIKKLEYISVVEVSNYEPYREWQVISYKGFD